ALPGTTCQVEVVRPKSLAMLTSLHLDQRPRVGLVPQRDLSVEDPSRSDLNDVGAIGHIVGHVHHEGLGYVLTVEVDSRARLGRLSQESPFLVAELERVDDDDRPAPQALRDSAAEVLGDFDATAPTSCGPLADAVVAAVTARFAGRLAALDAIDLDARADHAVDLARRDRSERARVAALEPPTGSDLRQLWVLEPDAEERIERDLRDGRITEQEAGWLREFRDEGYVVWERLVEPELIDALVADIRAIRERPGHFVSTDHKRTRPFRITGSDFDSFESIFDLYVNLESSRRVCFHPTITRFLQILFDTRPIAMQQLLFQRSNQHLLHQDTAYVCTRDALLMTATWIALEDVVPGRGELTYFERSHNLPHVLFRDGSKRFNPELDDANRTMESLIDRCEEHGCTKRDFIAKKGDVFLWAADLVHGSNPRTAPEHETRMSCVTHYCPETTEPLYFWLRPELRHVQPYRDDAAFASSNYELPVDGVARPVFLDSEPC
ncbi:MAG: LON peptidase substrate-binding domain-containing protein, partial [Planctomycetes bacterium]|nr:LON peptidase substrate-binding domain-containing protein [Planctomycetota bacterium]